MPLLVFIERNGLTRRIDAPAGTSLMRIALDQGVEGIEGVCGGAGACGTCHCYVAEEWLNRLPELDETEEFMLDETETQRRPNSRLGCQITLDEHLERSNGSKTATPQQSRVRAAKRSNRRSHRSSPGRGESARD